MSADPVGLEIIDSEGRRIFDQLSDSFVVLDADWRVVYVNPTLLRESRRPASDFMGRTVWEAWPEARGSEIERQYRRAIELQTAVHFEHHYVDPGTDVWAEIDAYPYGAGLAINSRNITARKLTEQALRESEERYRATFDSAAVGIGHVSLEGRWIRFNDAVCAITGYPREELETLTFAEITHPDDIEEDWAMVRKLLAGEFPRYALEKRYIRKNGSPVWVNLTVSLLRDEAGKPRHFISIVEDISARKYVEKALREREERLGSVLESIADAFIALDREWKFTYVNAAWERMAGIPRDRALGRGNWEVFPEALGTIAEREFGRAVRERTPVEFEFFYQPWRRWLANRVYPTKEGGITCYTRDITEQKATQQALRESEERYRSLVLATSAFIWIADARGEFITPQPSWQAYTGQSWEECRGSGWIGAAHPEDRERVAAAWRKCVETRSLYEIEWRAWHAASAEWRHCITRGVPVAGDDGRVREWICAVTDIHEQKVLDAKLQHEDKVESLGVLAGGVAHDFNNLLVGIMGNASLAAEDATSISRPLIEEVVWAAQRASALTRQMLAYAGKGRLAVEAVNLSEEVREVVKLVRSSLGPAAHLELNLAEGLPPIRADRGQVQQIVMNLVINAGEALPPEGGIIRVTTARDNAQSDSVALVVSDNGRGMTPEVRARIFDPFFTTKFTGRGLGLAAVLGVVRAHGGSISVDTAPGAGATFCVSLPAAQTTDSRVTEEAREEAPAASPTTVLVIDDEEVVRNVARYALEKAGMKPILAGGGREGLRIFLERAEEIDVVLLDATMPDIGGRDVLRAIRERQPNAYVIISSGHPPAEIEKYFGSDVPSALLLKPYKPAELVAAVGAQASKRRAADASG